MKPLPSFEEDKKTADGYLEQIRAIVKQCAHIVIDISIASPEDDCKRATDYQIDVEGTTIGCRIRNGVYFFDKFHDFTIRTSRPSGATTELEKIRTGVPRWYLYGWGNGSTIPAWIFVDMDTFRETIIDTPNVKDRANPDGTRFNGYSINQLAGAGCIVERSQYVSSYLQVDVQQKPLFGVSY